MRRNSSPLAGFVLVPPACERKNSSSSFNSRIILALGSSFTTARFTICFAELAYLRMFSHTGVTQSFFLGGPRTAKWKLFRQGCPPMVKLWQPSPFLSSLQGCP
eukprot:m.195563 g.195563  ORF g.195563 m.195563 type:complete len:104 (-) comp15232_c0_seq2:1155-1466(-)